MKELSILVLQTYQEIIADDDDVKVCPNESGERGFKARAVGAVDGGQGCGVTGRHVEADAYTTKHLEERDDISSISFPQDALPSGKPSGRRKPFFQSRA